MIPHSSSPAPGCPSASEISHSLISVIAPLAPEIPDSPPLPTERPIFPVPNIPDSSGPPVNLHCTQYRSAYACCVINNVTTPTDLHLPTIQCSLNAVVTPATGAPLDYPQLRRGPDTLEWIQATTTEIGRLKQGVLPHTTTGSETMLFIPHTAKPPDCTATYLHIVAALKPHKAEFKRIRFTVGGNRITYNGNVSTPTADLTTVKTRFNSVLSTPDACIMTIDIKDFYLNTPMERFKYMCIPTKFIPPAISEQYNLTPLIHNEHVMVEIRKGMYGLRQAGILANQHLVAHLLHHHGYHTTPNKPGLFRHLTHPITFSLVFDDLVSSMLANNRVFPVAEWLRHHTCGRVV
jgi:hypothetical protein